jgi:hypothetical protein
LTRQTPSVIVRNAAGATGGQAMLREWQQVASDAKHYRTESGDHASSLVRAVVPVLPAEGGA